MSRNRPLSTFAMSNLPLCLFWLLALVHGQQCPSVLRSPPNEKRVYRVGVLANRGVETAYDEFSDTFADYLSITVGESYNPPVAFEMVAVEFGDALRELQRDSIDFTFANPSVFSCVESESGASSLATIVSTRRVDGSDFELEEFGGVIIARSDNDSVDTVTDIKDKIVGTVSLTGLGSGQMQFRALRQAGLHHLQDPKQLIFMRSQGIVVNGTDFNPLANKSHTSNIQLF